MRHAIIFEKMTDEELHELNKMVNKVLDRRKTEKLEKAQEEMRKILESYEKEGIVFYCPDGYGGEHDFYSHDVYAKDRWK